MDINKLSRIKPAISHLYLKVNENFDEDYVETLKLNGFKSIIDTGRRRKFSANKIKIL